MGAWQKKKGRQNALTIAAKLLLESGLWPELQNDQSALWALEKHAEQNPEAWSSKWFLKATDNQFRVFRRGWKEWAKQERIKNPRGTPGPIRESRDKS